LNGSNRRCWFSVFIAAAVLSTVAGNGYADEEDTDLDEGDGLTVDLGVLVGGGFNQINGPRDPANSNTFLYGSAFSGGGYVFGASTELDFGSFVGLQTDLLFTGTSLMGYAEAGSAKREVTVDELSLQLTTLVTFTIDLPNPDIVFGLGPAFAFGLDAAVTEVITGFEPETLDPLQPDTVPWLFFVTQVGLTIDVGPVEIPVIFRMGWNPFYPDTTSERFSAFESADDPGPWTVGFDWQIDGLAGVRFHL